MRTRLPSFLTERPLWQIDAMGTLAVCAIAAVWYLAGIAPLSRARAERVALEAALTTETLAAQDAAKLAATQEASLQRVRAQMEASSIQLQSVDRINGRVSELAGAATGAGLRVDEIKPQEAAAHARFTTVPIRISGEGDYAAVTGFFRALRTEFRDTGITAFQVRAAEEGAEGRSLRFVLDLVWYAAPKAPAQKK